jgi:hypothetical protein
MPNYSVAYQDYFHHLAATPDPNPYISTPGTSHTSEATTVFLARRLTSPDGTFLGVVVAPHAAGFARAASGVGLDTFCIRATADAEEVSAVYITA